MRYPFGISPKLFWLIIGIIVIQGYYFIRKEYIESKNWPMTKGRIVQSELSFQFDSTMSWYEPRITYEYQVKGIRYTSDAIFIGVNPPRMSEAGAKSIINRYQFGKEVMVFYNPNHPKEAFLERRISYPCGYILPEQK